MHNEARGAYQTRRYQMTQKTYAMLDYSGEDLEEGLSLEDYVHSLLTGDGGS